MNTPGVLSAPSCIAANAYTTRPPIRRVSATRTAEMCQPATASTRPASTSRPTSSATTSGGRPASTWTSSTGRPAMPLRALSCSTAS